MATMDLLKATINGKIGNVYGARQRAQTYLKAVPFSHTPHSQSQTKSVRAFEKLNRLSAGIAKGFWQFMGLSDRKMLKHNAVAALLKPAIENKTFLISNLGKVIKKDGTTEILNFVVDRENNSILLEAQTTEQFDKKNGSAWVCLIIDDTGYCYKCFSPEETYSNEAFRLQILPNRGYFAITFRSDKRNNRQFLHGLSYSNIQYVTNGVLHIDWFSTKDFFVIQNNALVITDETTQINNGKLVLTVREV